MHLMCEAGMVTITKTRVGEFLIESSGQERIIRCTATVSYFVGHIDKMLLFDVEKNQVTDLKYRGVLPPF